MFRKQIAEKFKEILPYDIKIKLKGDSIEVDSRGVVKCFDVIKVKAITEISTHFFVDIPSSAHIIIPKNNMLAEDIISIRDVFDGYHKSYQIPFASDMNWRWK